MATFQRLLGECIFAGNAFITENNATAYQAVFGRQPKMLPPLETPDWCKGESGDGRKEARVREVALSSKIQAASLARTVRAMDAKSKLSGEHRYKEGDLVDVWTKPK